jgi:hypothetical protein
LSAKAQSIKAVSSQLHPKHALRIGHFRPHRFGAGAIERTNRPMCLWRAKHGAFLPPPPLRGRAGEGGSHGHCDSWLTPFPDRFAI